MTCALDVLPFVPLEGSTMDDCVRLAERVAEGLAEELGVATFLYGAAGVVAEAVRRGLETPNVRPAERPPLPTHPMGFPEVGLAGRNALYREIKGV